MEIDQRIKKLQLSIRQISELASKKADCIRFDIGQPDFDTPEHIKEAAIQAIKEGFTGYTSSLGIPELRKVIAERESRKIPDIDKNNVLVTAGGAGALVCSFLSFLKPNDEMIIPNPFWAPYSFQIGAVYGRFISIPYYNGEELNTERIEEKITKKTKGIIINSPENPTGRVYKKRDLEKIADIASEHNLFVISDEVYEKLIFNNVKHHSIASLIPEKTLLVNSSSKTYAMTGWRVGWLVAREEFIEEIMKCNRATIACPPSIAQKAVFTALTSNQSCVEEMRKEYEKRKNVAEKKLKEMGLRFPKPDGAFYVFPEIGEDDWKFALNLLEKKSVSVVPGSPFGSEGDGCIRIALTTNIDKIKEGLEKIESFLRD